MREDAGVGGDWAQSLLFFLKGCIVPWKEEMSWNMLYADQLLVSWSRWSKLSNCLPV